MRLPQDLVLGAQVLDDLLLLPVDQACVDGQAEVPGLEVGRYRNQIRDVWLG